MHRHWGKGATLILAGILILLNSFRVIVVDILNLASILLIFYGLITIVSSFQKLGRGQQFFTAVLLNSGIILYVLANYEILNWYDFVLPAGLFLVGSGVFVLYLDNFKELFFLLISIYFFCLSAVSILYNSSIQVQFANRITLILFDYWPLFLILFGVMLVTGNSKKNSSTSGSGTFHSTE